MGEIFWKDFRGIFLGGFFWENFFGRIIWEDFREDCFLEEFFGWNCLFYFDVEGIDDLFVKILIFVKILSESTRKEEGGRI